jgi:transglutaminase-like putative cysteine protease
MTLANPTADSGSGHDLTPFLPGPGEARRRDDRGGRIRLRLPAPPAEGWISLALLMVMGITLGWSLDDARWVLGRDGLTDYLPFAVVLGILWSFIAASAGWSRWLSHLLGAVFAALILPLIVGASLVDPGNASLHDWYTASASSVIQAYLDLAWRGRVLTQQYGHFVLILGLLSWATGQFAGYAAFGHRRPMTAVATLGLALLINMSITIQDQLPYLVIYSLAALLFLIRVNAVHEQDSWLRRRIGDPKAIGSLYVRGGVAFVTIAVAGSLFLTASASSAPLSGAFTGMEQTLIGIGTQLQRYLPGGGPGTRITGVNFGSNAPITGRWVTDATPALEVTVPQDDKHVYYWRAISYDHFDNSGWSLSHDAAPDDRAATVDVLDGTEEGSDLAPILREVTFGVQPLAFRGSTVLSPSSPSKVDQNSRITLVGGQYFGTLELAGGASPYKVTALVAQTADDDPEGLTENKLRAASTDYIPEIANLYLDVPAGSTGPDLRALKARIDSLSPSDNPYDLAQTTVSYLRGNAGGFVYSTDITDINCGDRSIAECFAHFKRGFCQYYATTMVMLMRMEGIPARYVQGFLPGQRDPATGRELVRFSNSHAWVEVFFPGYGWISFDPTGGGVGRLTSLPAGEPLASVKPTPAPSRSVFGLEERDPPFARGDGDITSAPSSGVVTPGAPLLIAALLLIILVVSAAFIAWRRGRNRAVQADAVYNSIARLASRVGFGPRPEETVFEYTGALAQVIPTARPELTLIANAKVEVAYGRQTIEHDRLHGLREAQRRLRIRILRLAFRRRRGR